MRVTHWKKTRKIQKCIKENMENTPTALWPRKGIFHVCFMDVDEPTTYEEAATSPNANDWITTMKEELSSMDINLVWELVNLPPRCKTIENKWFLRSSIIQMGQSTSIKLDLEWKDIPKREGIDYEEIFFPIVRFASIHLILVIVSYFNLELLQMDEKITFLIWELDEEIFIDQPKGFQEMRQGHKVCRLKHSIYGLKQSSRHWYYQFHRAITSIGFMMIKEDHCMYVKIMGRNYWYSHYM